MVRREAPRGLLQKLLTGLFLILLLPVVIVLIPAYFVYSGFLYLAVFAVWLPRGKDVLFIYSDSPHWKEHIESNVLPSLQGRAVVLNWSERSVWGKRWFSLAVVCFRHFSGTREFNPMAVVFRRFRRAKVFRFWQAFQDHKHGTSSSLQEIERAFFQYLQSADQVTK